MIYVMKGSEDGYIGTYGSKKKAIQAGINYILGGFSENKIVREKVHTEVREYDHAIYIEGPDHVSVEIIKDEIIR